MEELKDTDRLAKLGCGQCAAFLVPAAEDTQKAIASRKRRQGGMRVTVEMVARAPLPHFKYADCFWIKWGLQFDWKAHSCKWLHNQSAYQGVKATLHHEQ